MKNFNIKIGALAAIMALGTFTSCQQEDDSFLIEEEPSSVKESELLAKASDCITSNFLLRDAISGTDYNKDISTQIDDRSCSYDYDQTEGSDKWGIYRLKSSDNNKPQNTSKLQTRMERTSTQIPYKSGKYIQIKGNVKILDAGALGTTSPKPTDMSDGNGTYFAQVKGKHDKIKTEEPYKESSDPAIVLFIAKPKRRKSDGTGSIIKENGKIKQFNLYAEVIKRRGGSGSDGRRLIFIKTVNNGASVSVDIKTRFVNEGNIKRQYVDYNIGGKTNSIKLSTLNTKGEKTNPVETRIRIGAYRCRGGNAEIHWKNNLDFKKN